MLTLMCIMQLLWRRLQHSLTRSALQDVTSGYRGTAIAHSMDNGILNPAPAPTLAWCVPCPQVLDRSNQVPNPATSWISEAAWDNITCLEGLAAFKGIVASFQSNTYDWELWFRQQEPETAELPREWETKCTELQRMLLVRSLRTDRVLFAATRFVAQALGRAFVEPPVLDLGETYADSSPLAPLIFVLSPGVDPLAPLRKLAAEKGMTNKLHTVALGQGQVRGRG